MKLANKYTAFIAAFLMSFSGALWAQQVAITMDNPNVEATPLMTSEARDQAILDTLEKQHLKIVLFVQGAQVNNNAGHKLLQRWNDASHTLGNHTYSHSNIDNMSTQAYKADTLKNESLLQPYSHFKKIFRFPFLSEGSTAAKRDAFRAFLNEHHYTNGSVTIDASDWYISSRLEKRLAQNPNADTTPYKEYYLAHIWDRAQYYDKLAQKVLGSSPAHTLLIHHNLLNALFLNDLIEMFKQHGWEVIDADTAFNDPVFSMVPDTLPAGQSLIWSLAKQTGKYDDELRYPGEDGVYEEKAMDAAGL